MTVRVVSVSTAYRNGYKLFPTVFATKERANKIAEAAAKRHNADAVICRVVDKNEKKSGYRIYLKYPEPFYRGEAKTRRRALRKAWKHSYSQKPARR